MEQEKQTECFGVEGLGSRKENEKRGACVMRMGQILLCLRRGRGHHVEPGQLQQHVKHLRPQVHAGQLRQLGELILDWRSVGGGRKGGGVSRETDEGEGRK